MSVTVKVLPLKSNWALAVTVFPDAALRPRLKLMEVAEAMEVKNTAIRIVFVESWITIFLGNTNLTLEAFLYKDLSD